MSEKPRASGWVPLTFAVAKRAPWLLSVAKVILLAIPTWTRRDLVENTGANARWVTGRVLSPKEKKQFVRAVVGNFYEFVKDVSLFRGKGPEQVREHIVEVGGRHEYIEARKTGKGAVLVTAHLGSFEAGVAALREVEPVVHVVFKRDTSDAFEGIRSEMRESLGVKEIAIDDGPGALVAMRDALARNEVVVLQGDRAHPGQRSKVVKVCEGHMRLPMGLVTLARLNGSPIVPVFCVRRGEGQFAVRMYPAIEAEDPQALEKYADVLSGVLREHPEQWLVLHKAFVEDQPDSDAKAVK